MHKSQLVTHIATLLFSLSAHLHMLAIFDPITPLATKLGVDTATALFIQSENNKRLVEKYLSPQFHSAATHGCNSYFGTGFGGGNCAAFAQHLYAMEKHYAIHNKMQCLVHQKEILESNAENKFDTTKLNDLYNKAMEKEDTKPSMLNSFWPGKTSDGANTELSYFQSLTPEQQDELLALERNFVMEYTTPENYKPELAKLHALFDPQNSSFTN